jgi:quercetin dioxygenase-like cupin family protein
MVVMLVRRLDKPGTVISSLDSNQLRSGHVVLEHGSEVGEHSTRDGEEIIVFMEGTALVSAAGKAKTVQAPAVVLIPANTSHNVKNSSKRSLRYVYIVTANH